MHLIILVLLVISYPLSTFAKEISYPTNQVERPLTLPDGMGEVGVGVMYFQWENSDASVVRHK